MKNTGLISDQTLRIDKDNEALEDILNKVFEKNSFVSGGKQHLVTCLTQYL